MKEIMQIIKNHFPEQDQIKRYELAKELDKYFLKRKIEIYKQGKFDATIEMTFGEQ